MDNAEIQAKLKKLENIEQKRRERAKRYVQKRKEQGRRQISAIIPDSIFQVIQAKKQELGLSTGQIIEEAITKTYVNIVACTDDNLELTIENTNDSTDVIKSTIQTKDNHKPTVTEKNPPEKKDLITPPSKYPNNQHDLPLGDAGQEENLDSPDLEDEPDFSGPGEAPAPEPEKKQAGATAFKKPEPVKEMDTSEAKIKKFNKDEISKIIVSLRDDQKSKPSFQAIADKLHDMGYRSKKKGSRFHHSTVQNYYEYGKKL